MRSALRVAVINQRGDPIGKRVHITNEKSVVWREIVGVVGDTKQYGRDAINPRQIYEPCLQKPWDTMTLAVRTGWRSADTRQRGPCASPSN